MASSIFDSDSLDPSVWIKKDRLEKKLSPGSDSSRPATLDELLFGAPEAPVLEDHPIYGKFEAFLECLVQDQLKKPEELLKLNPSRRESLGRFLSELSRLPEPGDPQGALRQFVRPDRSEREEEALIQLFRQIALVQIAKALLLKSWRAHSGTPLSREDLKDLTAAIERDLRPFLNLQTSSSQLIQRNFYSWSKLTPDAQTTLGQLLEVIPDLQKLRCWLLARARKLSAETLGERQRYSEGFYRNLWRAIEKHKLFQRKGDKMIGFSPTLRDGCLLENSPETIEWMGFEPLTFELIFCEVRYLWKQPRALPLWLKGNGLEMSMEQQGSLLVTHCGKQNTLNQMDSISCAEIALIAEETPIRTQERSLAAQALRKIIDQHSVLKKIKQPATTRGMYQACQTLDKLRQNGILIWAREELLNEDSGKPALHFLLNQARILMIADLGALVCESDRLKHDLPKALYILKKDHRLEERKSNRPLLVKAYGSVRTERDIELLFDRVAALSTRSDLVFPPEPFQLQARISPMDQREWEQHWFNPSDDQMVAQIEELKRNSIPLGQFATLRTFHPALQASQNTGEPHLFSEAALKPEQGFYAWIETNKNGNEVFTSSAEKLPHYLKNNHSLFWIVPLRPEWIEPLTVLLRSSLARDWFDYSVERKKGAWIMRESDLRSIPVPRHLGQALEKMSASPESLGTAESRLVALISTEPHSALRVIENKPELKGMAFLFAAQTLEALGQHQGTLFSMISPDEQICYPDFFKAALTPADLAPLHTHPLIRFTPTLAPHQAIHSVTPMKFPTPGLALATPKGLTQILSITDSWLRDRCLEQIHLLQQEIAEPTWEELCRRVLLPRNPEQAQNLAHQLLRAYSTEKMRRKELNHLVSVCLLSPKENAERVGLLQ